GVWALERDQMIACHTARVVYHDMLPDQPSLETLLPADADGTTAPPTGAPAPLVSMNPTQSGLPDNTLQLFNATVNWSGTPSLTIAHSEDISVAPYDSNLCDYRLNCI